MKPTPKISQGSILVSDIFLDNTCFKRSVVLLTEHKAEGSFGFIINKPTEVKIADAIEVSRISIRSFTLVDQLKQTPYTIFTP
jgi:putative AlgH/UPF0301 family transcriptional regulator